MERFSEQIVVVSGGARGMGASHVRGFHAEGGRVVIADLLADEGRALADELGPRALFTPLDVTDVDAWNGVVEATEERFGHVNVLVNNAAIIEQDFTHVEGRDPEHWRRIIDVNLFGTFLGIKAVVASMREAGGGSIINIGSVGAFVATPGHSAYAASKWAIRGFTKVVALELGRDNIRVNTVHPGITNTLMHAQAQSSEGGKRNPDRYKQLAIPRVAEPDEVTRIVMFVASSDAGYCTGSDFTVDGGFLLGKAVPKVDEVGPDSSTE